MILKLSVNKINYRLYLKFLQHVLQTIKEKNVAIILGNFTKIKTNLT